MPFQSKAQERWAFTPEGRKALGGIDNVKEWANSTDQKSLPEKKEPTHKPSYYKRKEK
jgi:hypothetical protein